MNEMYKSIIGSLIRFALTGVFAAAVNKGIITGEQAEWLILWIVGLVATLAWSVWQKYVAHIAQLKALYTPVPELPKSLD